jgi:hypothetical protein
MRASIQHFYLFHMHCCVDWRLSYTCAYVFLLRADTTFHAHRLAPAIDRIIAAFDTAITSSTSSSSASSSSFSFSTAKPALLVPKKIHPKASATSASTSSVPQLAPVRIDSELVASLRAFSADFSQARGTFDGSALRHALSPSSTSSTLPSSASLSSASASASASASLQAPDVVDPAAAAGQKWAAVVAAVVAVVGAAHTDEVAEIGMPSMTASVRVYINISIAGSSIELYRRKHASSWF